MPANLKYAKLPERITNKTASSMKKFIILTLCYLCLCASIAQADSQFKLLVFAVPNKYHYEYIPVARDSLEKLAKLHAFEFTWTNQPQVFEGDLNNTRR